MSYYHSLTPEQIIERRTEFNRVFDTNRYQTSRSVEIDCTALSTKELTLISDYVGYLAYRSFRMMRKYQEKEKTIIEYMEQYQKADYAIASFIEKIGMSRITTVNPLAYRIMTRFINTDSL